MRRRRPRKIEKVGPYFSGPDAGRNWMIAIIQSIPFFWKLFFSEKRPRHRPNKEK
jgi:hypothetical protein